MAVAAASVSSIVLLDQGDSGLPGGNRISPAIVLSSDGLTVALTAFMAENDTVVLTGVAHATIAAAGAPSWSWPAASGNSNA